MRKTILFIATLLLCQITHGQIDSIKFETQINAMASSGKFAPFWTHSQQYGEISSNPFSNNVLFGVLKDYNVKNKTFDWGFKIKANGQLGNEKQKFFLQEYYAKARWSVFDLCLGARQEIIGNQDSTLSSGGFLFSKNTRPIPKLSAGIERFTPLPFTYNFAEIRGGISHGWFTDNVYTKNLLLHHKFAYLRLGGKLPVRIQYGIDHVAQWGGKTPAGDQPSSLSDFVKIFFVKSGGLGGESINKLGNHIVEQSMRVDATVRNYEIAAYWQIINEDGPIRIMGFGMNTPDGLWGISIKNNKIPFVHKILYEYFHSSDQSGPFHDRDGVIYGGADYYFYNYVYESGWTYFNKTIGTPLITSPIYNKDGSISIKNSRVVAHHFGLEGDYKGYSYRIQASFTRNLGIYSNQTNINQTYTYIEVAKKLNWLDGINLKLALGNDFGKLTGNSTGILVSLAKKW